MEKGFCVFWLPRLYHKDLTILDTHNNVISEDISDNVGNDRISILSEEQSAELTEKEKESVHHVSVEINTEEKENKNITIVSKSGTKEKTKEVVVVLEYVSSSRNGLIQFFYKTDNRNPEAKFITLALSGAIYHLIKGFFHKHEYHAANADSTLFAYTSVNKTDLSASDNPALMFYLEQYEKKFRGYRESVYDKLSFIEQKNEEGGAEKFSNYETRHKILAQQCINALGESLYYNTLLYSWYNDSCRYNNVGKQNESITCTTAICKSNKSEEINCAFEDHELCKRLHRSAVNSKNAIDSIRQIQLKNKILYDYLTGEFTLEYLEILQCQIQTMDNMMKKAQEQLDNTHIMLGKNQEQLDATYSMIQNGQIQHELTNEMIQNSQSQIKTINELIVNGKKIEIISICLGVLSFLLGLFSIYLVFFP